MRNGTKLFVGASVAFIAVAAILLLPRAREFVILNRPAMPTPLPKREVSFMIGGDMMFARNVHYRFQDNLFESVAYLGPGFFDSVDAAAVNLEGAISATAVTPDPGPTFKFVFPPETVGVLRYLGIDAVSLDNNHSDNAGPGGRKVTSELLAAQGIATLPATFQGEGLKLTIVGVHTLWGVPNIKDQISKIKNDPDQRVVVFPHWGVEYAPKHSKQQEELAHAWIDAGADMVVGAHPHVVQDAEMYRGKPIIYSLGNLLFDQDWSTATQRGLLVRGIFRNEQLELFVMPVISKNYQPMVASDQWIPFSSWISVPKSPN